MADEENIIVSVQLLASLFNLSVRRINQLANDGIIPKIGKGQYSLKEAIHGYAGFLNEGNGDADIRAQKIRAEIELTQYKAANEKINYLDATSELLASTEVEQGQERSFNLIAKMLDNLPDVLERGANLPPDAVERIIAITGAVKDEFYDSLIDTSITNPE